MRVERWINHGQVRVNEITRPSSDGESEKQQKLGRRRKVNHNAPLQRTTRGEMNKRQAIQPILVG